MVVEGEHIYILIMVNLDGSIWIIWIYDDLFIFFDLGQQQCGNVGMFPHNIEVQLDAY